MPHLAAVNLHDRCPSSISTSKISHMTENSNWFWINLEGHQLTHPRPVQYKNSLLLNQQPSMIEFVVFALIFESALDILENARKCFLLIT